jgi:hypothetical protein
MRGAMLQSTERAYFTPSPACRDFRGAFFRCPCAGHGSTGLDRMPFSHQLAITAATTDRDEELSDSALNEAIAIYKETRPKLVISHPAPSEAAREILKDLHGSYFLSKQIDLESRTSHLLQEMFEAHQPSAWYFGRFHVNQEFLIGETKVYCLADMAIAQLSEVFSHPEGICS